MLDTLKHGVDDNEAASPAYARAVIGGKEKKEELR